MSDSSSTPTATTFTAAAPTTPVVSWTLSELVASANIELARAGLEAVEERTVRFWRTRHLVSPSTPPSGRTAKWSWEHLREIVGVRTAQTRGIALSELADRGPAECAALSNLPDTPPMHTSVEAAAGVPQTGSGFWDPAPAQNYTTTPRAVALSAASPVRHRASGTPKQLAAVTKTVIALSPGVELTLDTELATAEVMAALPAAAADLVELVARPTQRCSTHHPTTPSTHPSSTSEVDK